MLLDNSISTEQIKAYLSRPDTERQFVQYDSSLLYPTETFSTSELDRFEVYVRLPDNSGLSKHILHRVLVDLSWASSRLEGNSYTQLETYALIEYGAKQDGKPLEDAAMILNHKHAVDLLFKEKKILNKGQLVECNAILTDNTLTPDSQHFLPAELRNRVRSFTPDGLFIGGSSYIPPQEEARGPGFIDKELDTLLSSVLEIQHPINQAFFLLTRIPYLQAFYDGNKRTARIACNGPLLQNGLSPISFIDFDKSDYLAGMVSFYELKDERLMKDAFTQAYLATALKLLPAFNAERKLVLKNDFKECVMAAKNNVLFNKADPFTSKENSKEQYLSQKNEI